MKILIVGDSFAADWSAKYKEALGWPNLLAEHHTITNLSQAGVGEYKIYKQLMSVNLSNFDLVIIAHTSPYRVHTRKHPVHLQNKFYKNADLIYADIEYHLTSITNWFNKSLQSASKFFVHHYDEKFQETIYELIRDKINTLIGSTKCIVIHTHIVPNKFLNEKTVIDINEQVLTPNLANHLSKESNRIVCIQILDKLNEIK
jgi:hypothetical protein